MYHRSTCGRADSQQRWCAATNVLCALVRQRVIAIMIPHFVHFSEYERSSSSIEPLIFVAKVDVPVHDQHPSRHEQ